MPRTVNEEAYRTRRNEILDFVSGLIYSKGYDRMTIQDILDGLQISRGALYHYFDSKKAILEALVDRMGDVAIQSILPIFEDPELSALEKFGRYFEASAYGKKAQKELILSIMPMWFSDENAFVRQKMTVRALDQTSRLLVPVIRQGIREQVFTTRFPEEAAVIVTGVLLTLGDTFIGRILSMKADPASARELESTFAAYIDAIERILGAPSGSMLGLKQSGFGDWIK